VLQEVADFLTRTAVPRNEEEFSFSEKEKSCQFTASRRWRKGFMDRHRFWLRQFHMKRKSNVQPGALNQFRGKIAEIMNSYPVDHIVNMDETS
jgi:hypothetical protein